VQVHSCDRAPCAFKEMRARLVTRRSDAPLPTRIGNTALRSRYRAPAPSGVVRTHRNTGTRIVLFSRVAQPAQAFGFRNPKVGLPLDARWPLIRAMMAANVGVAALVPVPSPQPSE
jgi:hypothetical protein